MAFFQRCPKFGFVSKVVLWSGTLMRRPWLVNVWPNIGAFAPGYPAKKFSKLRFSWITMTTCLMYWLGLPEAGRARAGKAPDKVFDAGAEHAAATTSPRQARARSILEIIFPPSTVDAVPMAAYFALLRVL